MANPVGKTVKKCSPMNLEIYKYNEFSENAINTLCECKESLLLIHDSKLEFKISNSLDLNMFRTCCYKSTIDQLIKNTVVFYIKKITDDILYCINQLVGVNMIFYTDDEGNLESISTSNIRENIEVVFYENVKKNDKAMSFKHINDFEMFKIEYCINYVTEYNIKNFAILTKNSLISNKIDYINAIDVPENIRSVFTLFVFDNENIQFESFEKVITIASECDSTKSVVCNDIYNMKDIKEYDLLSHDYLFYLSTRNINIFNNINIIPNSFQINEIRIGKAKFPFAFSRYVFDYIIRDIKSSLESCLLYIRFIKPEFNSQFSGFKNKEYKTTVKLPGLFDISADGGMFIVKKDSIYSSCCEFIRILYNINILDDNLNINIKNLLKQKSIEKLYLRAYGTNDYNRVYEICVDFYEYKLIDDCIGNIIEKDKKVMIAEYNNCVASSNKFKKKYMIDLIVDDVAKDEHLNTERCIGYYESLQIHDCNIPRTFLYKYLYPITPEEKLVKFYRKISECLLSISDNLALYSCSVLSTGILCKESFTSNVMFGGSRNQQIKIEYLGTKKYSSRELKIIKFYQVIFFGNFTGTFCSKSKTFVLYYYAVPIKNNDIDWDYLNLLFDDFIQSTVMASNNTSDFLIWNPFSKLFLNYYSPYEGNIEDSIGNGTFLSHFETKNDMILNCRTGRMMFRALISSQVSSKIKKRLNIENYNDIRSDNDVTKEKLLETLSTISIGNVETYQSANDVSNECVNHVNDIECLNIKDIFKSGESTTYQISSSESCFVTNLRASILNDVELFKINFYNFESAFLANELINAFEIPANLSTVISSLTQSCENKIFNYERLEFLGDCFLKFYTTNFLYVLGYPMNSIVSIKDSLISNDNLFEICIRNGIFKYFNISISNSKGVQPPFLEGMDEIINYFGVDNVFSSDYLFNNINFGDDDSNVKKVYADVIESLLGAIFYDCGILDAVKFLTRLQLYKADLVCATKDQNKNCVNELTTITNLKSIFVGFQYRIFKYECILEQSAIQAIQDIIGYVFKNPGFLERAFIHPSFVCSKIMNSEDFEYLELIGDSALDLFVSSRIYRISVLESPLHLHCAKMSYVNNLSLSRVFIQTGLIEYAKYYLPESRKYKKFSDMMEALLGAILLDLEWDFNEFEIVCDRKILGFLEIHRDLTLRGSTTKLF